MPEFDNPIQDAIILLQGLQRLGKSLEVYYLLKVDWPSPGRTWYSNMPVDEVASVAPYDDDGTIDVEARIVTENNPNWFLPVQIDSSIGDEEIDLEFWDGDGVISQLIVDNGEGVKCQLNYWFPQVELLLPIWDGHLRNEDEASEDTVKLKAVQGIRSSDYNVPSRAHYSNCMAIFGGLFTTQAQIDAHDCPYNRQIMGGLVGNLDPSTGLPWTYCDRQDIQSCITRGINPLYHLSHRTSVAQILQPQHGGPALLITSEGNETNLKEPVPVAMGTIRAHSMPPVAFSTPSIQQHGWFHAQYEASEGPIRGYRLPIRVTVAGQIQVVDPNQNQFNFRLGTKGQTVLDSDLTHHGYSGTAMILYHYGWIDTTGGPFGPSDASASAIIDGLNNIRVYSDADTYAEQFTNNRAWQIARVLCDNRWGFGKDYDELAIDSWIESADWSDQSVSFTDPFGDDWVHRRGESHVYLTGKKVQQQIEDMCMAGRLSRPFLFNGKIHIIPLRKQTTDELNNAPLFTDQGEDRNIIRDEDGKSTLTISRKSDYDLINRVECTFNDAANDWLETPLNPIEDVDAQLAAGAVEGDGTRKVRKVNSKKYILQGVTNKAQAIKMGWSLLDLGPNDEGGLRNNLTLKFKTWFSFTLELHLDKVIQFDVPRLTKYGFTHFRVKKMNRQDDLTVELEVQAYPIAYMDTFEDEGASSFGDVLTVSGAGDPLVNDIYAYAGQYNGKSRWINDPYYIQNNGSRYELRYIDPPANGLLYRTIDNPTHPWDGVWTTAGGAPAPPPTVTQGIIAPPRPDRPVFEPVTFADGVITIG